MDIIELFLTPFIPNKFLHIHWVIINCFMIFMSFYLLYSFRKKIFNKKTIITLIIIATITILFYYPLIKDKDFFAYDETDIKYYYSIVKTNELGNYDFYASTGSLGYIYILMNLFWIFEIKNIFQAYNLIVVVMFFLFFIFNLMMYLFFKKRGFKRSDIILIIATIVTNMSFLLAIYRLKVVYFMVFLSLLLSYFLLKRIEKTDNKLLNILFISNFLIGAVTRPEFLVYSLVFAYKYILIKKNSITHCSGKKNKLINKSFFVSFLLIIVLTSALFYFHAKDYNQSGHFLYNLSVITNNIHGDYNSIVMPVFFTLFFLTIGLTNKKTRLITLLFLFLFLYQMNPSSFDIHLLNFYCLMIPIIYFYEKKGTKILYFAIIFALIFNASIICFTKAPFQDGNYILKVFNELNQNKTTLYVDHPSLFFGFLFKDSNVIVLPIEQIYDIAKPNTGYVITEIDYAKSLINNYPKETKFKTLGPLSIHDSTLILKFYNN